MNQTEQTVRPRKRGLATRVALAVAVTLGFSLAAASPASAHTDWVGSHTLCKEAVPCVNSGNLVLFWQRILWADEGYSDLDGVFGPNTADATIHWQQIYNSQNSPDIDVDGWVGLETWLAMQQNTYWGYRGTGSDSTYFYYTYRGRISGRSFLIRETIKDSITSFKMAGASSWTDTSHGS